LKDMIVLAALVGVALAAVADVVADFEVVASGLNDPRFITSYNGRVYFTTAGAEAAPTGIKRGGGAFELRPESGDDDDDDHHYHLRQLASFDTQVVNARGGGFEVSGAAGIAVHDGRVYVVSQLSDSADEVQADEISAATGIARELDFGRLVAFDIEDDDDNHDARKYVIGNPGAAGYTQTAIGTKLNVVGAVNQPESPDTDPYGIYYDEKDDTVYVANAASNFLQAVKDGETRTVAFFPATAALRSGGPSFNTGTGLYFAGAFTAGNYVGDATPTSVTKGPDGYLYVCTLELLQFLIPPRLRASNIYRVDPRVSNYVVTANDIVASGLATCTDVHYSHHHHAFFAAELFGNSIARFDVKRASGDDDDDSSDDGALTFGPLQRITGFTSPNGLTTDSDGRLFVVDGSNGGATGRVLRVKV